MIWQNISRFHVTDRGHHNAADDDDDDGDLKSNCSEDGVFNQPALNYG